MDLTIFAKGNAKTWTFTVHGTPEMLADLRSDGFVVDELLNAVPRWMPFRLGCFLQDLFRFRNPWR